MNIGARLREARKERDLTQTELGDAIGVVQSVISEIEAGKLKSWPQHASKIATVLGKPRAWFEGEEGHIGNTPDVPEVDHNAAYARVQILPTYAGLGGGGTGEGDVEYGLVANALIEGELRAKPADLLIINVRGDSMFDPNTGRGFMHGDQLIIDTRDRNPRQAGAFALWYDDGYVVKNVERVPRSSRLRIFSNNPAYSADEEEESAVKIMGRPVWYARRL